MKTYLQLFIHVIALLLISSSTFAQFNSQFEENTFKYVGTDSLKTYDLLHALNYNPDLYKQGKQLIESHITSLKSKGLTEKPLKKQVQTIYKSTHSKFFKKYEAKAFFNDIFRNGEYNCVTATALYALIFDEFNINYAIKETPTHVYMIADTLGLQTLIESTLPDNGIVTYNEKFKKDFIEYLHKNKIISDLEYNNSTTEELFRQHYSKHKSIDINKLAALQYYNKGVFLLEEQKYKGSSAYLDKASRIYPSNSIKYLHFISIQSAISEDYNKKVFDGNLFAQLINHCSTDSSLYQLTIDYFTNISIELCLNTPDIDKYKAFYYKSSLSKIPNEISIRYHYYLAYNNTANNNYPSAFAEMKYAYEIDSNNILVKELTKEIGFKHLFVERKHKSQIDSMEYYFKEFPFLKKEKLFQQQYVYYYMKVISDHFIYKEPTEGKKYLDRFILAIDAYDIEYYSEEHISIGFASVAFYYLEQQNFTKAQNAVNTGLEIAPESLRLKQTKKEIEQARQTMSNYKNYASNYNNQQVMHLNSYYSTEEELKNKIDKYFPGKWKAVSIVMEDMEQELTESETFEFVAQKDKDCSYTQNGKTEKGKWSYRKKSKCIYFVPNYNKDKYKVFKVKEVNQNKIILLPYKDQKSPSPYKYVLKPVK